MRNVAFSIMLVALALLQIAVVAAELSHSGAKAATAGNRGYDVRQVLASTETERKASTL